MAFFPFDPEHGTQGKLAQDKQSQPDICMLLKLNKVTVVLSVLMGLFSLFAITS
jgi:hypothetical protein